MIRVRKAESVPDARLDFCPVLRDMVAERSAVGESGKHFDGMGALSTVNNLLVLRRFMMSRRPDRTLEIGLCYAGSALAIAASHKELGRGHTAHHLAIDPYQRQVWDNCGRLNLQRAGLSDHVSIEEDLSCNVLPRLMASGRKFDLIFVDGSHIFEDVFVDAYYSLRCLKTNGVIIFDDCTNHHVKKVIKFLKANMMDSVTEFNLNSYRDVPRAAWVHNLARASHNLQLRAFRLVGSPVRPWNARYRDF